MTKRRRKLKPFTVSGCRESLTSMPKVDGGLYCSSCEQKVWDLTRATEAEVVSLIEKEGNEICVMIRADNNGEAVLRVPTKKPPGLALVTTLLMNRCGHVVADPVRDLAQQLECDRDGEHEDSCVQPARADRAQPEAHPAPPRHLERETLYVAGRMSSSPRPGYRAPPITSRPAADSDRAREPKK